MLPLNPIELGLLAAGGALLAAVGLSVFFVRTGRARAGEILRGARNGTLVALVLLVAITIVVALLTVGRPAFFSAALPLDAAILLGLIVGLPLAIGYLLVGLLVMLGGLAAGRHGKWPTRDAWVVGPGVAILGVAAFGFASGVGELADRPITRAGTVTLSVDGAPVGRLAAQGQARCTLEGEAGNLAILAGAGEGSTLAAADGRLLSVQLGLPADDRPGLVLSVGDLTASSQRSPAARLSLAAGSNRYAGSVAFAGLAPLVDGEPATDDALSGMLSWQCSF